MEIDDPTIARAIAADKIVVFTDLDGTLLDHETYDWRAAAPALAELKKRGIPVVLVSSKTLAELAELRSALDLLHPVVAENGCYVDIPVGYFEQDVTLPSPALTRDRILTVLDAVRSEQHFKCLSFHELGTEGIAMHTGLPVSAARLANMRMATEPLLWNDTPARLRDFEAAVARYGLRCLRGGRFVHLMGESDKAIAMQALLDAYRMAPGGADIISVALGDSPNDLALLRAADVAVVIPGHNALPMPLDGHRCVLRPRRAGPAGWLAAMQQLLGFD